MVHHKATDTRARRNYRPRRTLADHFLGEFCLPYEQLPCEQTGKMLKFAQYFTTCMIFIYLCSYLLIYIFSN